MRTTFKREKKMYSKKEYNNAKYVLVLEKLSSIHTKQCTGVTILCSKSVSRNSPFPPPVVSSTCLSLPRGGIVYFSLVSWTQTRRVTSCHLSESGEGHDWAVQVCCRQKKSKNTSLESLQTVPSFNCHYSRVLFLCMPFLLCRCFSCHRRSPLSGSGFNELLMSLMKTVVFVIKIIRTAVFIVNIILYIHTWLPSPPRCSRYILLKIISYSKFMHYVYLSNFTSNKFDLQRFISSHTPPHF